MAGIDAIKNLKETTRNSFDDKEKEAVSKISLADMTRAKTEIEGKTFNFGGSSVTLRNIVLGLSISPDGSGATYKGKKIEAKSELGAALQTLLLINGKSIGAPSIDGTIGPRSAASLQQLQSEMKSGDNVRRATEIQQQTSERVALSGLKQFPLGRSFDNAKAGTFNRFKKMQLLDDDGCLKSASISGTKCTINYKSKYNNSSKSITVEVKKNSYGEVDVQEFVKDVIAKVDAEEKALKLKDAGEKMVAGINNFDESKISNPVVRKWAELKGINFKGTIDSKGRVVLSSKNNDMKQTQVYNPVSFIKNGEFNEDVFNRTLTRDCYAEALPVVRDSLQKILKNISTVRVSSLDEGTAAGYIKTLDQWRKTIKGYGKDFNDIDKAYLAKRNEIQHQKNYVYIKNKVNTSVLKIRSLAGILGPYVDNNLIATNFDSIITEFKKIAVVEKKGAGHYAVNYNTDKRGYFEKVGKKEEYNKLVDSIVDVINGRKIKVGGETITYTVDKLNR